MLVQALQQSLAGTKLLLPTALGQTVAKPLMTHALKVIEYRLSHNGLWLILTTRKPLPIHLVIAQLILVQQGTLALGKIN
jgi:hypothetical protein